MDVCPAEPSPHMSEVSDQAPQSPPPAPVTSQPQRASLPPDADQVTLLKRLGKVPFSLGRYYNFLKGIYIYLHLIDQKQALSYFQ